MFLIKIRQHSGRGCCFCSSRCCCSCRGDDSDGKDSCGGSGNSVCSDGGIGYIVSGGGDGGSGGHEKIKIRFFLYSERR